MAAAVCPCTAKVMAELGEPIEEVYEVCPWDRCQVEGCEHPCKTCGLALLGVETLRIDVTPVEVTPIGRLCLAARGAAYVIEAEGW